MPDQYVKAVVCGIPLTGLKLMVSQFGGFDTHTGKRFEQGTQIAYLHQSKLNADQTAIIFANKKRVQAVTIAWPMVEESVPAEPVQQAVKTVIKSFDFVPSEHQQAIRHNLFGTDLHILIEALAGAGKTSTLVWLVKELAKAGMIRGKRIVYLAFNRKIKDELNDRLQGTGVSAMTTHGFGFQAVKARYCKPGQKIEPRGGLCASNTFTRLVCEDNGLRPNMDGLKAAKKTEEYRALKGPVLEAIGYIKNWAIFPDNNKGVWSFSNEQKTLVQVLLTVTYEVEVMAPYTIDHVIDYALRTIIVGLPGENSILGELDFDDMLYLPLLMNLPFPKYDLVLTDESQDFNDCQILMLERLGCRTIVVGDRNQSLYAFRGANSKAFDRIKEMLERSGRGVVVLPLPVNYRCDANIIEYAQQWVPSLQGFKKTCGTVDEITFTQITQRANNEGTDILLPDGNNYAERALPIEGHEPITFAFLCRINVPLVITAYHFLGMNKRVCIVGREQIGEPLKRLCFELCGSNDWEEGYTDRIANRVNGDGHILEEGLLTRLGMYLRIQTQKLQEEDKASKLEAIQQNVECLEVIAQQVMDDSVRSIIKQIDKLFVDEPLPGTISLSTIHRSKGLEWDVVGILRPDLLPHPNATSEEEIQQEMNACYVAATRARHRLYYIVDWPFGKSPGFLQWSIQWQPKVLPPVQANADVTPVSETTTATAILENLRREDVAHKQELQQKSVNPDEPDEDDGLPF